MATSDLAASDIWISLGAVYVLYTLFLIAEMYLMVKFSRRGPSVLKTGRYYHEQHRSLDNVIDNYK
jgi:cytochrome d ubiquinol oxidase subunit I